MSETADKLSLPYVAFKTFRNYVRGLGEQSPLPSRIDKSGMGNLAYGTQAALLAALKGLGLTSAEGHPTPRLEVLAHEDPAGEKWKAELTAALKETYPFLWDDPLFDLTRASAGELQERFRKAADIRGSTVDKVVTFFLAAANDAGAKVSPHFAKRKPISSGNGKRSRPKARNGRKDEGEQRPDAPPPAAPAKAPDMAALLAAKFPEFDPAWSDEIKMKWFEGFESLWKSANQKPE